MRKNDSYTKQNELIDLERDIFGRGLKRGGETLVAQKLLDGSEIGAVVQLVGKHDTLDEPAPLQGAELIVVRRVVVFLKRVCDEFKVALFVGVEALHRGPGWKVYERQGPGTTTATRHR